MAAPKRYAHGPIPGTCECDRVWKKDLCRDWRAAATAKHQLEPPEAGRGKDRREHGPANAVVSDFRPLDLLLLCVSQFVVISHGLPRKLEVVNALNVINES